MSTITTDSNQLMSELFEIENEFNELLTKVRFYRSLLNEHLDDSVPLPEGRRATKRWEKELDSLTSAFGLFTWRLEQLEAAHAYLCQRLEIDPDSRRAG